MNTTRIKPTEQIYEAYTAEDFQVWQVLFDRQMANLKNIVSAEYLKALDTIQFTRNKIPNFKEVNEILEKKL